MPESEVPEGWVSLTIQDVCEINPPKPKKGDLPGDTPVTFVPMPAVDAERGEISSPEIRPFSEVRSGFTAFRNDDVIMAKITPCMENGKAAVAGGLVSGLGFGSTEFLVLRSNGSILPQYLFHYIRQVSFRELAESNMAGSVGQKRVPKEFIANAAILLPPLVEQHRIVAAVEALFARLDAANARLERVPGILKQFRQAVLAAACDGRLTEEWRAEQKENRAYLGLTDELKEWSKSDFVNDITHSNSKTEAKQIDDICTNFIVNVQLNPMEVSIPPDWGSIKWKHIGISKNGRAFPSKEYCSEGVRLLRPGNLAADGNLIWHEKNTKFLPEEYSQEYPDYIIGSNELVINLTAQSLKDNFLGRICYTDNGECCLLNQRIAKLTPVYGFKRYFFWVFKSPIFRNFVKKLNTGSLIQHMFTSQLNEFMLPLPPLPEQHEIVRRVDALFALADKIEAEVAAARGKTEMMRQSILAQAFSGRLVPTEAELARQEGHEYEPASVLLERIHSEKKEKKGRNGVQSTLV